MSIEAWWPRLPQESRDYLIANNGDVVPDRLVEEIAGVGGPITTDAWWVGQTGPAGFYLSDEAIDWIDEVANGETPLPHDEGPPAPRVGLTAFAEEESTARAKVISTLFISADGVAEIDPAWHFPYFDENMGRAVGEDYDTCDVLLIGRVTYDSFAGAWPDREAAGGDDAGFAKQLGDLRKVVVTRQPLTFTWRNSERIDGDLVEAVTRLKADPGVHGVLIPGSISIVQQLLAAGLVDELRLLVHPVAARTGRRLFDDGDQPYHLKLVATEVFPTGVIRVSYAPTDAPAPVAYDAVTEHVPEGP